MPSNVFGASDVHVMEEGDDCDGSGSEQVHLASFGFEYGWQRSWW